RAIGHVEVADHSFASLINKKGVAKDASPIDRCVAGQNFGVDITQNHFCRPAIVPRKQAPPELRLVVEKRTQIHRRKMSEVENLQSAPASSAARKEVGKHAPAKVELRGT